MHAFAPGVLDARSLTTHCPLKGEASYFAIVLPRRTIDNAVWRYAAPLPGLEALADRVAFYAHLVDRIEVEPHKAAA